jgi:tRNA pseudouridine55 synthase
MFGFINFYKPLHWTSHDCVAKVRRLLKLRKVGHGGTLDPLATGVLPIAVGQATRLLAYLPPTKAYRATIRFGLQTSTDDLAGEVLNTQSASIITLEQVTGYLPQFCGTITQIPPQYSAIQREGKRLYELARQGKIVEVPARQVRIDTLTVLGWQAGELPELVLEIACGEGTYIRAIARDLGRLLGVGGTLAGLERIESGGLCVEDSLTMEQLADRINQQQAFLTPPEYTFNHLSSRILDSEQARRWCQGQKLLLRESELVNLSQGIQIQDQSGRLLGMGKVVFVESQPYLTPQVVLG